MKKCFTKRRAPKLTSGFFGGGFGMSPLSGACKKQESTISCNETVRTAQRLHLNSNPQRSSTSDVHTPVFFDSTSGDALAFLAVGAPTCLEAGSEAAADAVLAFFAAGAVASLKVGTVAFFETGIGADFSDTFLALFALLGSGPRACQ